MITIDGKSIFIHIPRTGGFYITATIRRQGGNIVQSRYRHFIPQEKQNLYTFCFVRNPFDWYVSYWMRLGHIHLASPTDIKAFRNFIDLMPDYSAWVNKAERICDDVFVYDNDTFQYSLSILLPEYDWVDNLVNQCISNSGMSVNDFYDKKTERFVLKKCKRLFSKYGFEEVIN